MKKCILFAVSHLFFCSVCVTIQFPGDMPPGGGRLNRRAERKGKAMTDTRTEVVRLVETAIATGDYNYIRQAMNLCTDESGVWMAEDEEFVMVDDDVFYFNGAF